jgi:hypothetical protein
VAAYTYCLVQEAQHHHHQHHIDPYTSRSLRFAFAAQSYRRHLSTCNLQRMRMRMRQKGRFGWPSSLIGRARNSGLAAENIAMLRRYDWPGPVQYVMEFGIKDAVRQPDSLPPATSWSEAKQAPDEGELAIQPTARHHTHHDDPFQRFIQWFSSRCLLNNNNKLFPSPPPKTMRHTTTSIAQHVLRRGALHHACSPAGPHERVPFRL